MIPNIPYMRLLFVIMEVDIVHFREFKWNVGRALENDDGDEDWQMIQQEKFI